MRAHLCSLTERYARRPRKDNSRFRLSAVISNGARVISHGINHNVPVGTPESHPLSVHAEIAALRRVPHDSAPTDLYVCRLLANGQKAISRPCSDCWRAILNSTVESVHFIGSSGNWETIEITRD